VTNKYCSVVPKEGEYVALNGRLQC